MGNNSVIMERMKICTYCDTEKPISSFSKHRLSKDGHAYQCKECNAKRAKIWRRTPAGIYSNIRGGQRYYKKHGTRNHKPVTITQEEFVKWYNAQPKECVYCGIEESNLGIWINNYNRCAKRLTIDCKDNNKGYVLGNIVLSCFICNFIKGNMFSFEEMREIGQKYVRPRWENRA